MHFILRKKQIYHPIQISSPHTILSFLIQSTVIIIITVDYNRIYFIYFIPVYTKFIKCPLLHLLNMISNHGIILFVSKTSCQNSFTNKKCNYRGNNYR